MKNYRLKILIIYFIFSFTSCKQHSVKIYEYLEIDSYIRNEYSVETYVVVKDRLGTVETIEMHRKDIVPYSKIDSVVLIHREHAVKCKEEVEGILINEDRN